MKKRLTALVFACLLAASVTSCSQGEASDPPSGGGDTSSSSQSAPSANTTGKLTEETVTFDIAAAQYPETNTGDNATRTNMENITNVKMNIIWIPSTDYGQKIDIMMAGGDYPEIITGAGFGMQKQMQYGTQEQILLPLNEYIERYPEGTLASALKETPAYAAAVTAPDGNVYGFAEVSGGIHSQVSKMWINKDWVDQLDEELPETLDEYRDLLRQFKTTDLNGNGVQDEIPLTGAVNTWEADPQYYLLNAFIETDPSVFLRVEDQKVSFVANTEEFKEGLKYIHDMYQEGLIDPSAFTQDEQQMRQLISSDPYPVGSFHAGHLQMGVDTSVDYLNHAFTYLEPLEGPEGVRVVPFHSKNLDNGVWSYANVVITDKCKDPDLAYRFVDYMTSDEGILLGLGEEGKWWKKPEEGQLGLDGLPALYVNVQPQDADESKQKSAEQFTIFPYLNSRWHSAQAVLGTDIYDLANYEYRLVEATNAYEKYAPKEILPYNTMQLSEEDISNLSDIKTNIVDCVKQNIVLFILGERDIDLEWETYCSELEAYNLEEYIAINQRGLDTWLEAQK